MKAFALAGVLATCVLTPACMVTLDSQSEIARDQKQFSVKGTPSVQVTTFDGSIQIQSWDKPEVLVQIEKRGPTREAIDALEVKASQDGDTIVVEVAKPPASLGVVRVRFSATARLMVWLPKRSDIKARSGDGAVSIEAVDGRIDVHTGDGSIRANGIAGELTLNTGDGAVTVERAQGRLRVDTGDGGVNVSGSLSGLRVHTGDGSIVYRAQSGTEMTEDWDITTGDGGVLLYLPSDFSAELDAHTGDGGIRNDFNIAATGEVSRRTVRGRLGAGGRQLRIRTGDGAIRLTNVE